MSQQYRVTRFPHFIGGRMVYPDRGDESLVFLDKGVEPGQYLEKVSKAEANAEARKAREADEAEEQKALLEEARSLGLKPHHATGPDKLREQIAEAKAKDGGGTEGGPGGKDLPDA